jgi:hypothetical protein
VAFHQINGRSGSANRQKKFAPRKSRRRGF